MWQFNFKYPCKTYCFPNNKWKEPLSWGMQRRKSRHIFLTCYSLVRGIFTLMVVFVKPRLPVNHSHLTWAFCNLIIEPPHTQLRHKIGSKRGLMGQEPARTEAPRGQDLGLLVQCRLLSTWDRQWIVAWLKFQSFKGRTSFCSPERVWGTLGPYKVRERFRWGWEMGLEGWTRRMMWYQI